MIRKKLHNMAEEYLRSVRRGEFPKIGVPSRNTSNIVYDDVTKQYVLGDGVVERSAGNVSTAKSMMQLIWAASLSDGLLQQGKTTTMRGLYYASMSVLPDMFDAQSESDKTIFDLEAVTQTPRELLGVYPAERNSIYGDMLIQYTVPKYVGKQMRLDAIPDGMSISPALATAEYVKTGAECVIAVEKTDTFTRLYEDGIVDKYKAIIVDLNGQASRNARIVLHRITKQFKLPLYVFTDADPWGMYIARVISAGSAQSAHLRDLVVPDAKWMGMWATDITKYDFKVTIPMKEVDIKKCRQTLLDPRFAGDMWQRELKHFIKIRQKVELQAFAEKGLDYITKQYIPMRLES